jgi:cyclin-dependent kinase
MYIFINETQTMLYRAPEVFLQVPKVLNAIDIWSVGCVFAEMLRGEPFFHGNRELELLESIFQYFRLIRSLGRPTREECEMFQSPLLHAEESGWEKPDLCDLIPRLNEPGLDLLSQMLAINPAKRITATYAKNHEYFLGYKERVDYVI